jgi:hypothetical protein
MQVTVRFVGFTTNATATYTTKNGTFPVTCAKFRISNVGPCKVVQEGLYGQEAKRYPHLSEFWIGEPEIAGALSVGESKTVSIVTPWSMPYSWRPVFLFSKYSWKHRVLELPPWKQQMIAWMVPTKWLVPSRSESIGGEWVEPLPGG